MEIHFSDKNHTRKLWIDNLRWITIILVVIFHAFFYYNNLGVEKPVFQGLEANPGPEGIFNYTFAGIFQYAVYPWFMLLLFVLSGICAKFTLQKKTVREFIKSRTLKLLVPSTLGILTVQWISGYLNLYQMATDDFFAMPKLVKYVICVFSGTGALWFCQILYVASLLLALIKVIDKNGRFEKLCEKSNLSVAVLLYPVMTGAAQIFNIPVITTYRMAYYPLGFLLGYYVFSGEKLLAQLKKWGWIFLAGSAIAGFFYVRKFYGTYYGDYVVQNNWLSVLYAWLFVAGILGVAQNLLDFSNSFCGYISGASFGIYVNHIIVMQLTNILLKPAVAGGLSIIIVYIIEFIVAVTVSLLLWEFLKRIPVLGFVLYGIKKQKLR